MNTFFKSFFATLLAMVVFFAILLVMLIAIASAVASKEKEEVGGNAVLLVDLSKHFSEIEPADPFAAFSGDRSVPPSLYHVTRMIRHAATNNNVKGIYLKCENNNNDFGASEELRNAIQDFKNSGKFVIAYANFIPQKAYYIASVANKVYCAPTGGMEWHGFSMTMPFVKGTLEKMEIEPQIFYAGKFKSATEPFRETEMTAPNRLQSQELLNEIYNEFLLQIATARKLDTAVLKQYADSNALQFASAAMQRKMVDGLKYDDEVKDEMRSRLKIDKKTKINFVTLAKYSDGVDYMPSNGSKIAVIYAEGTIMEGDGDRGQIGSDSYRKHIRKARMDESLKGIVLRVNSGGGSAMASEVIWREIVLAKKVKPVIVSFGDVAASGGYYIACGADSIFAESNTITGSIGVFGLLPNMQKFFNNKLGVTFDEVKTSPNADLLTVTKPLSAAQKQYFQSSIDTIYHDFKTRVAQGRKLSMDYVDSVAQGRVWSGTRAVELKLVDRIGGLDDAIAAAAAKAGLKEYWLREYPGKPGILETFLGDKAESSKEAYIRNQLGAEGFQVFNTLKNLKQMIGTAKARIPFEMIIE